MPALTRRPVGVPPQGFVSPVPSISHAVLVADDDAIIRDLLRSLLTEAGYTVIAAVNGDEALTFAPHLDASLAIIDLAMPHRDGLQTCEALRRLPSWHDVPILMLTSHHTDEVLRAARRAGVSGFVCKPFVPSELLQRIERLTGDRVAAEAHAPMAWTQPDGDNNPTQPAPATVQWQRSVPHTEGECGLLQLYRSLPDTPSPAPTISRKNAILIERHRILVAEDEDMTREIITHVLTHEGYLVNAVSNGQQALAAIITDRYDLVLMDVRMPVLNGFDATRVIRSLPNSKRDTIVIAMTANAFSQYAQEMKGAGLNGYLMKPVSATSLLSCVRQHLGGQAAHGGAEPVADVTQVFDIDQIHTEARVFAPGAISRFLENLLTSVDEVLAYVRGWSASDPADLRRRLHNLAGIAGTLGCAQLSEIARSLEAADVPSLSLRERFVDTAGATTDAIRQYLNGAPPSAGSA